MELKTSYIYISLALSALLLLISLSSNYWYSTNSYIWGLTNSCLKNDDGSLICANTTQNKNIIGICKVLLSISIILTLVLFFLLRNYVISQQVFDILMCSLIILPIICIILSYSLLRKNNNITGNAGYPFLLCILSSIITLTILLWNKKFPNIK
jgi:hypothetical protein